MILFKISLPNLNCKIIIKSDSDNFTVKSKTTCSILY